MAILDIRTYPDPILKQPAALAESFDRELEKLLDNMAETMYQANGIGLAAPQIGISKRIAVIDVSEDRSQLIELINPQIKERSGELPSEEGCLSIPGYRDIVPRAEKISLSAQDRRGKEFAIEAEGLFAICIQHEIDHLDGVLFVDRLSRLKRELFKSWFKKQNQPERST